MDGVSPFLGMVFSSRKANKNASKKLKAFDRLKRLVFDDDSTIQLGLNDFGNQAESYKSSKHLIGCDKGAIGPLERKGHHGSEHQERLRGSGRPDQRGWPDIRPQEVCWPHCQGGRAGRKETRQTLAQTLLSDWNGDCNPRPVGRTDTVHISTPKDTIRLDANKTFAGKSENGNVGCKHCKSHKVVKWGKSHGKQRYRCNECGKTFCDDGAFPGMRTSARIISASLELYFDGLSLAKISRYIWRSHGIKICRITVWKWIQKYVPLVKSLVDQFIADATSSWHADETMIKVKGVWNYFWDGIDYNSRFIIMGMLTTDRTIADAKMFFKGAKKQVGGNSPSLIITDGCGAYEKGVSKIFWDKVRLGECKYIRKPGLRAKVGKMSNNIIERFHNTVKERMKTTRWFKSFKGAENAMFGFVIQYNFLRPHMALNGMTPAKKAGLDLPFENGWGDLIQWSETNQV